MKFDFVIGNPPYQDEASGNNRTFAPPVYDKFLEAAYSISDRVEMIHPARFLFHAGSTPKQWNDKMLNDKHFRILSYYAKSGDLFPNTDIKGGVVISFRNRQKVYGALKVFTPYPALNSIFKKVTDHADFTGLSQIAFSRTSYRLTETMFQENPIAFSRLHEGNRGTVASNIFLLLPEIFFESIPDDGKEYIQILGRKNTKRTFLWIRRDYLSAPSNFDKYKIFLAAANGSGTIGETLSTPLMGMPFVASTESFISIGAFLSILEAETCIKYLKTKFARILLGMLKVTQAITPGKMEFVPLQDFTSGSDIDWSVPIPRIDEQLYKKYKLSQEEILFIESTAKEMA